MGGEGDRLWHRVVARRTVRAVFLLAYTDLRRGGRATLSGCTARSLRRVGADVAVVLHCTPANAKRLRRDARYDHVVTYSLEGPVGSTSVDVAVLSDCLLKLRPDTTGRSMLCDVTVDGKDAAVTTFGSQVSGLYTVLLRIDASKPVVLVGDVGENLDDPATIDGVVRAGFVDTHPARPSTDPDRDARTQGILVKGLRAYGDGTYLNPDGCQIHWARLGH
jgi:hypothetical protein